MTQPNFLLIGAAKAGTTALATFLDRHPQVFMSHIKEPMFFALERQPIEFTGPGDHILKTMVVNEWGSYLRLFSEATNAVAVGEASTWYLCSEEAPARIKLRLPEVRILCILRDPAARAYSAFLHLRRDGREPEADFAAALAFEDERVSAGWERAWHYRRLGLYANQVERYLALFRRDRVHFLLHEEFYKDPQAALREIFRFLGVDPTPAIDTSDRHNVSGIPRNSLLYAALTRPSGFRRALGSLFSRSSRQRIRERLIERSLRRPPPPENAMAGLRAFFAADVLRLETMLGRDLSVWPCRQGE
jgi:sulfotransferase family protein